MAIQSGGDLQWIRPILPDDDAPLGAHRGNFEALNVRNAQRGFHYYYPRKDPSQILRFLNMGWEVVTKDHPESYGAELPPDIGLPLDGVQAFHDVVLMRIPKDQYRAYKAERIERRRAALEANYIAFKNKERERLQGLAPHQRPQGRDLYYQGPGHGTHVEDIPSR